METQRGAAGGASPRSGDPTKAWAGATARAASTPTTGRSGGGGRRSAAPVIAGTEEHELARGDEYASHLIEARETGNPVEIYVNVANAGLIDNLPSDGVVEVAAIIDADGVHPQPFGRLPSQFAAPVAVHMAFHDLVATSVLEQDREAAIHALMIDPLTSAVCSLAEIRELFEEMVAAERDSLPEYVVG